MECSFTIYGNRFEVSPVCELRWFSLELFKQSDPGATGFAYTCAGEFPGGCGWNAQGIVYKGSGWLVTLGCEI